MCIPCIDGATRFCVIFFFFKQKTAYELRISDWSSDVCSSDLWWATPPAATIGRGASATPWRRCWSAACRRVRRPLRRDGGLANRGAATDIPWTADPHGRDPMAADDNPDPQTRTELEAADRKSTRLNSSH